MNFFSHALVASWRSRSPVEHPEVAAGVELHHQTDRAFHRLPVFVHAMSEIQSQLMARGLGRGPAAGAAHVGFEICLDVALIDEPDAVPHYLAALEVARGELRAAFTWPADGDAVRWQALVDRLASYGPPRPFDPGPLAERVTRARAGRPRLALDVGGTDLVRAEMPDIAARATAAAPGILLALRVELCP